jgi:hypothetical protein
MKTTKSCTNVSLFLTIAVLTFSISTNSVYSQDKKSSCCKTNVSDAEGVVYNNMNNDSTKTMKNDMQDHSKMKMDKSVQQKDARVIEEKKDVKGKADIVRKGTIDLKAIDVNKDEKVYQDQMDWNVISDQPGKCPLCKMTLVEVSLSKAKENLTKNGFNVK